MKEFAFSPGFRFVASGSKLRGNHPDCTTGSPRQSGLRGLAFLLVLFLCAPLTAQTFSPGTLDPAFAPGAIVSGRLDVYALVPLEDGGMIVGGAPEIENPFQAPGKPAAARLAPDGRLDPLYNSGSLPAGTAVQVAVVNEQGRAIVAGGPWPNNPLRFKRDGSIDPGFQAAVAQQQAPAVIRDMAQQPDGKLIVAGNFDTVNAVRRQYVARLNPDGTTDERFLVRVNDPLASAAPVHHVVVQRDGKVVIAGDFTEIRGVARHGIARLYADGSLDESFNPGAGFWSHPDPVLGASIRMNMTALALAPDQKIYVAGTFRVFNGKEVRHLVRLNPDGSLDDSFRTVSLGLDPLMAGRTVIQALAVQWNGKLLVTGDFTEINGVARNRVARLLSTGEVDLEFVPPTESSGRGLVDAFSAIVVQPDGAVVVGGSFDRIGQTPMRSVMRLIGGDPGAPANEQPVIVGDPVSQRVTESEPVNFRVFVKGAAPFTYQWQFNGSDLAGATNDTFTIASTRLADSGAYTVRVQNASGLTTSQAAALTVQERDTGDPTFREQIADGEILAMLADEDGNILVAGGFTNLNGIARHCVARLQFSGELDESFVPAPIENDATAPAKVRHVAQTPSGQVYIEGDFTKVGGQPRRMLARLHPDGSLDEEFIPALTNSDWWFALQPDGKILSGNPIVRLRLDGTVDPRFTPYPNRPQYAPDRVRAVVQDDGRVWAMQFFDWTGGWRRPHGFFIESWKLEGTSASTSEGLPPGVAAGWPICLLPRGDGNLLFFSSSWDVAETRPLMLYNQSGELLPGLRRGLDPLQPTAIVLQDGGRIILAGAFTEVDAEPRAKIARLLPDGALDAGFVPQVQWEYAPSALAVQPNGEVLAAGGFKDLDEVIRWKLLRLAGDRTLKAPVIRRQPAAKTVLAGDPTGVSVSAWGWPMPRFQWQLNGADLPGATNARLSWSEVKLADGGLYSVLVSNEVGATRSSTVELVVLPPSLPRIVSQPADVSVKAGSLARFSVTATNFLELFYQWQRDGLPLLNETNATLTVTNVLSASAFTVVVSNRVGAVTSEPALLTILPEDPIPGRVDPAFYAASIPDALGAWSRVAEGTSVVVNGSGQIYLNVDLDVVRLFPNGARDSSFNPVLGLTGGGRELMGGYWIDYTSLDGISLQQDGSVLIRGLFTQVRDRPHNQVARLTPDGALDDSFQADPGQAGASFTGYYGPRVKHIRELSDGVIFLAGFSQWIGGWPPFTKVTPLGHVDTSMDASLILSAFGLPARSEITAVRELESGKLVVAGNFSAPDKTRVFRIYANGTQDMEFRLPEIAGSNTVVHALAAHAPGALLLGGSFETVNGTPRTNLARLDWEGTLDPSFAAAGLNGPVTGIVAQPDGKIIIFGDFDRCQGVPRNKIVRLNGDGSLDLTFDPGSGPDGAVHSVALQADGHVVVGGFFTNFNGVLRRRVARLFGGELPGAPVVQVQSASREVFAGQEVDLNVLASSYVPATFQWSFNGVPIPGATNSSLHLSRIGDADAGEYRVVVSNPLGSADSRPIVLSVTAPKPPVIVQHPADSFVYAGQTAHAFVSAESPLPLSYQWFHSGTPVPGATNTALRVTNVRPEDAGRYSVTVSHALNAIESRVAVLSVDPSLTPGLPDLNFDPASWPVRIDPKSPLITAAIDSQGRVLVGGHFLDKNGADAGWLIRINEDGSFDEAFPRFTSANNPPYIFVLPNGKVLLELTGPSSSELKRLNNDGSLDAEFEAPAFSCSYVAVAVRADGKLMVMGAFGGVGGEPRNGLARLQPDGAVDPTFQPPVEFSTGPVVMALQADGKTLAFCNWQGQIALVRLNEDGSRDSSFAFDMDLASSQVLSLAEQSDGRIVMLRRGELLRLNASGGRELSFAPKFEAAPNFGMDLDFMAVQPNDQIVVVGRFERVNGVIRRNVARLSADGTLDPSFDLVGGVMDGWFQACALAPNDDVVLTGSFMSVNGVPRAGIVRLHGRDSLNRPILHQSRWVPDGFEFQVQTELEKAYVPEFKDLGVPGSWQALPGFPGDGRARRWCDPEPAGKGRIYRLRVE